MHGPPLKVDHRLRAIDIEWWCLTSLIPMQGFKPGQEFIVAVQEGQKIGADIVLGDQVRLGKGRVTSLVHAF